MASTTTTTTQESITAQNVLHLFPEVQSTIHPVQANGTSNGTSSNASSDDSDLAGYDAEQIRLMDEVCIVLDEDDNPIGNASKKTCHLMHNISRGLLHRAFSVFLFDNSNRLLLQQRASEKITFPDMWTNTCCSHPLAHASETGGVTLQSRTQGAARAAQRKLGHELGVPKADVPVDEFAFLTRIHYIAPSVVSAKGSEGKWGEHEIDYILLIQPSKGTVDMEVNANEVRDIRWVTQAELREMIEEDGKSVSLTPWFRLVCEEGLLWQWWDQMEKEGGTKGFVGEEQIRKLGDVKKKVSELA